MSPLHQYLLHSILDLLHRGLGTVQRFLQIPLHLFGNRHGRVIVPASGGLRCLEYRIRNLGQLKWYNPSIPLHNCLQHNLLPLLPLEGTHWGNLSINHNILCFYIKSNLYNVYSFLHALIILKVSDTVVNQQIGSFYPIFLAGVSLSAFPSGFITDDKNFLNGLYSAQILPSVNFLRHSRFIYVFTIALCRFFMLK